MTTSSPLSPDEPLASPRSASGRRKAGVWALVVVGSFAGLLAIFAIWINDQLLSDSSSAAISTALVRDATVRSAVSGYVVDQLYANVNVSNELEQRLPSQLKPLAGPAAAALRDPAVKGVSFLLTQPSVQSLFVSAATDAHRRLINVLENKTGYGLSTGNGNVQVDLTQLVRQLGTDLGLPASALNSLPANTGVFTVMRSSQLGLAQTAVQAIRVLSVWLIIVVLAMYALALYLAEGFRRHTLRNIGWAFVIVGVIVILFRRFTGDYAIGGFTTSTYEAPAQHIWIIGTSMLSDLGWATVLYGVLIVLGATLAGPTRAAVAVRRRVAPVVNERPGITWGAVAVAYVLVVLWGGTYALRSPVGILVLGALAAAGVYVLRRQTQREFPDVHARHDFGPALAAATGKVRSVWASRPATPRLRGRSGHSSSEELGRLAELHAKGALTDDEFARAKARILE